MILEKWKQCDTYVQGVSHRESGEPCQDRTYSLVKNGVVAISLADGAGTKRLSHLGAEVVTHAICEMLCDNFDEIIVGCEIPKGANRETYQNRIVVKNVLSYLIKRLDLLAIRENVPLSELSSTLLFFAMKDDFCIYGHIGDGVIGVLDSSEQGYVEVVSKPENGSQPNITFFVTDADAENHLRIYGLCRSNIYGAILMSDGTADLLYKKNIEQFNENTVKVFNNYKLIEKIKYQNLLKEFLTKTVARFSDDDLSINILYRESISTQDNVSMKYRVYFVEGVKSKEQLIEIAANGYLIKDYAPYKMQDFSSAEKVLEYLEW